MSRTCLLILWFACGVAPTFGVEPEFRSLFNGKDLSTWDAEPGLWRIKDGVIEGGHPDAGPIASSFGSSGTSINRNTSRQRLD